jgi:hypothetical protein
LKSRRKRVVSNKIKIKIVQWVSFLKKKISFLRFFYLYRKKNNFVEELFSNWPFSVEKTQFENFSSLRKGTNVIFELYKKNVSDNLKILLKNMKKVLCNIHFPFYLQFKGDLPFIEVFGVQTPLEL